MIIFLKETIEVKVLRFYPTREDGRYWKVYKLPNTIIGRTVLEALEYIFENLDGSLAFSRVCRRGSCGCCTANINGKTGLTCRVKITGDIAIKPLPRVEIIKDLIIQYKNPIRIEKKEENSLS